MRFVLSTAPFLWPVSFSMSCASTLLTGTRQGGIFSDNVLEVVNPFPPTLLYGDFNTVLIGVWIGRDRMLRTLHMTALCLWLAFFTLVVLLMYGAVCTRLIALSPGLGTMVPLPPSLIWSVCQSLSFSWWTFARSLPASILIIASSCQHPFPRPCPVVRASGI